MPSLTPMMLYDPARAPGTEDVRADGTPVRYVEPEEYFVGLLATKVNATLIFIHAHLPDRVPSDRLAAVDDALAEAYWSTYQGCLMPPRVLRVLAKASEGAAGQMLIEAVEAARQEMFAAPTLPDAIELHAQFRLQALLYGVDNYCTEYQCAAGEFLMDYLLLQRAIVEDVRRAERERAPGETRAAVLERMDKKAELEFEKAIGVVLRPQRIVELIPPMRRADVEAYAQRRRPIYREGVFSATEQGDPVDGNW